MKHFCALFFMILLMVQSPAFAEEQPGSEPMDKDPIFRALGDEIERSTQRLELRPHKPPYFVEYSMIETDDFVVDATLGAISGRNRQRTRTIWPNVRVGSYKFDNFNFMGSGSSFSTVDEFAPMDNDYFALRRVLWLMTDHMYKDAVQTLEEKKAFLLEKNKAEELDDFTIEKPLTLIQPVKRLSIDTTEITDRVRKLSALFREFPDLYDSYVSFDARVSNTWLANSEGTRTRLNESSARYILYACVKTKEGLAIADWEPIIAPSSSQLPEPNVLEKSCRDLVTRLKNIAEAPLIEDYEGPVLFEGAAAAEFFTQALVPKLTAVRSKVNDVAMDSFTSNPLSKKVGKRVLPVFLSVVDDPLIKSFQGVDLRGGYEVDSQGVRAQRVTLIENGILKTFCASRTPTREVKASNGHGYVVDSSAATTRIFIESKNQLKQKALYNQLKKLGHDAGLDYVYVVRTLSNPNRFDTHSDVSNVPMSGGPNTVTISNPLLIYKLSLKDGSETLVRGARFIPQNIRILKNIVATGSDTAVYNCERTYNSYHPIITPSILIGELELERISFEQYKPPILQNPMLETQK